MKATPFVPATVVTAGTTAPAEVKSPGRFPLLTQVAKGPSGKPVASRLTRMSPKQGQVEAATPTPAASRKRRVQWAAIVDRRVESFSGAVFGVRVFIRRAGLRR